MPEHADDTGRDQHQADRGQRQRPGVRTQRPEIRHERGDVEQRRQEDHEHEVRVERDVRSPRQVAEGDRPEHEHDRVGDVEQTCDHAQGRERDAEAEDQELSLVHGQAVKSGPSVSIGGEA